MTGSMESGLIVRPTGLQIALPAVVPLSSIKQLIECDITIPPPFASPWVVGFGMVLSKLTVFVQLGKHSESHRTQPRLARGLLINAEARRTCWALEIDSVAGLKEVKVSAVGSLAGQESGCPTGWFDEAVDEQGQSYAWIKPDNITRLLLHSGPPDQNPST